MASALGFGVGLRAEHYPDVISSRERKLVDWFEAITENYMDTGGRPLAVLDHVRRDHPVGLHGVGLSIGSSDPLDRRYLARWKRLVERIEPAIVSDHLCWSGVDGRCLYDLLPMPATEEALEHVVERVRIVQDFVGRRIALENPSTYISFQPRDMTDAEFLAEVAKRADCEILLDVNNVYVSAVNLGFDPCRAIDTLPRERVVQYHLAGFTDRATYLFDTHDAPVSDDVLHLYAYAVATIGPRSTLVEWDAELPAFARLCEEAERARAISKEVTDGQASRAATTAIVADSG